MAHFIRTWTQHFSLNPVSLLHMLAFVILHKMDSVTYFYLILRSFVKNSHTGEKEKFKLKDIWIQHQHCKTIVFLRLVFWNLKCNLIKIVKVIGKAAGFISSSTPERALENTKHWWSNSIDEVQSNKMGLTVFGQKESSICVQLFDQEKERWQLGLSCGSLESFSMVLCAATASAGKHPQELLMAPLSF